jgi:hypothetical protein
MAHVTIAASEKAFEKIFTLVRDNFSFSIPATTVSFGPFSATYSVKAKLSGGTVQLNNDGTVEVKSLDVIWTELKLTVCLNLPGACFGGWCIIPDPWNGCLVGVPEICIGGPLCLPIDLSGLVSEINSIKAHLKPSYFIDPARDPAWTDLEAEFAGKPNKWRIFLDADFVSVDPIDVPASIGNLFENMIETAFENMIPGGTPGWIVDILMALLAPVIAGVKATLGIIDKAEDWLSDLLDNQLDLFAGLETAVADYFAAQNPIYEFEDPYPILPASGGLIPVKIPIRDLQSTVNSKEMIVEATVGV